MATTWLSADTAAKQQVTVRGGVANSNTQRGRPLNLGQSQRPTLIFGLPLVMTVNLFIQTPSKFSFNLIMDQQKPYYCACESWPHRPNIMRMWLEFDT